MINLSIIVPVYNEIGHLDKFIEKILNSFKNENVEYIFVDDGSNDGSGDFLKNALLSMPKNKCKLINLNKNYGKGKALHEGIKISSGKYILFQDADLELNTDDSLQMLKTINMNQNIKCLFGTRYLSGKLIQNVNPVNKFFVKLNTMIFNLLFNQSLSDLHCGTKIISKEIIDDLKLTIPDFGFEIDISAQIVKKKYKIHEFEISYSSRTKKEGKKITWKDGLKSYYYLFKSKFL